MSGKAGKTQVSAMGGMADFMPSKFGMIHAVADVVLIVGVTFWLNSKINAQAAEIQALKAENEEIKARLAQIENVLRQMLGQQPEPTPPQAPPSKPVKPKKTKKVEVKESPTNSEEESSEEVEQVEVE